MTNTITFTPEKTIKIEAPVVVFEGSIDQLRAEQAAIDERIGDYDEQIAEMQGVRAKLVAQRDEKVALIASVEAKAEVEKVKLEKEAPVAEEVAVVEEVA